MTDHAKLLFLGSGASMGIPVVGCSCKVCTSESPCNQRLRPSVLLTIGNTILLIDAGPDFRRQALHYKINSLDGLILTHAHHDHTAGLDELRVYYMRKKKPMPCLMSAETALDLRSRYYYIFDDTMTNKLTTRIHVQLLEGDRGKTTFDGVKLSYFSFLQGGMTVNGFRFGNMAYLTDVKEYPETIFEDLKGVEILILNALSFHSTPFHLSVDEVVAFANRVEAKQTWITHISHELDHEETNAYLPPHVRMSYDGLELHFSPYN